jgi:SAM-dependent methyltransferase
MTIAPTGYWTGDVTHKTSPVLATWIRGYLSSYKSKCVYDFGCGTGEYLKVLKLAGFKKLQGFEGSVPSNKVFDNIVQQDLTEPFKVKTKGAVICLECAEHIPAGFEDVFLSNISNACDSELIMSWAIPGQGGYGHVNESTPTDVIKRIRKYDLVYAPRATATARLAVVSDPCWWFKDTLLVFRRGLAQP